MANNNLQNVVALLAGLTIAEVVQLRDIAGQQIETSIRADVDGNQMLNVANLLRNHILRDGTQYNDDLRVRYPAVRRALINVGVEFLSYDGFVRSLGELGGGRMTMMRRCEHFIHLLSEAGYELAQAANPTQEAARLIEVIHGVEEWAKEAV